MQSPTRRPGRRTQVPTGPDQAPGLASAPNEPELLRRAAVGDPEARSTIVSNHLGTVLSLARERAGRLPVDDLVQEGSLGLIHAIQDFQPGQGQFADYARRRAAEQMDAALRQEEAAERECDQILAEAGQFDEAEHKLARELHRAPTQDEMARRLGWSRERVESIGELVTEARQRHDEELLQYLDPERLELDSGADNGA